jgi:hypothetical protein
VCFGAQDVCDIRINPRDVFYGNLAEPLVQLDSQPAILKMDLVIVGEDGEMEGVRVVGNVGFHATPSDAA